MVGLKLWSVIDLVPYIHKTVSKMPLNMYLKKYFGWLGAVSIFEKKRIWEEAYRDQEFHNHYTSFNLDSIPPLESKSRCT